MDFANSLRGGVQAPDGGILAAIAVPGRDSSPATMVRGFTLLCALCALFLALWPRNSFAVESGPPAVEISRRSVSFGAQQLGKLSARQTVAVRNTGGGTLNISAVTVGGRDGAQFSVAHDCGAVETGSSCSIFLTFRPTSTGSKTATLSVSHDAQGSPSSVVLSGVGTAISLVNQGETPSPSTLSDLDALKYVASYPDLVEVIGTDIAKAKAHYATYGFSEGRRIIFSPLRYAASYGDLIEAVATDETRAVLHFLRQGYFERRDVIFDPALYGSLNPDLKAVVGEDPAALTRHFVTEGYRQGRPIAPEPVFFVSRSDIDFGSQTLNASPISQIITLRNTGMARLSVSGIQSAGPDTDSFSLVTDCTDLATAASCSFTVTYRPSREGTQSAEFRILHNGFGSPSRLTLAGTGVAAPLISLSQSSVSFGTQRVGAVSTEKVVVVRNEGTAPLSISRIALAGNNGGDFVIDSECGAAIPAAGSCLVRIAFKPGSAGRKIALLSVEHNAADGPRSVSLEGTGVAPLIQLSTSSRGFGLQPINTSSAAQTIVVSNTGSAPLSVGRVTITGDNATQFSQVNDCVGMIPEGSSCAISVRFSPSSIGMKTASVLIEHDAVGSPSTISLSGEGAAVPSISVSTSSLTFGGQLINATATAQVVTITNTGNAGLSISGISITGAEAAQFAQTNTCTASLAPDRKSVV